MLPTSGTRTRSLRLAGVIAARGQMKPTSGTMVRGLRLAGGRDRGSLPVVFASL